MNQLIRIAFIILLFSSYNSSKAQASAESEVSKNSEETKITEVVTTDSVPAAELVKRAVNWVKLENSKFKKTAGVSAGSKAECIVSFGVRPKELNPQCDYTGKIQMKVIVECKDSKYRYTITHIKHTSTNGKASAGSIDNIVPECGSMIMPDLTWKKLKGEAMKNAGLVVNDLKEGMTKLSTETPTEDW